MHKDFYKAINYEEYNECTDACKIINKCDIGLITGLNYWPIGLYKIDVRYLYHIWVK